jgi:hypothetical protein
MGRCVLFQQNLYQILRLRFESLFVMGTENEYDSTHRF